MWLPTLLLFLQLVKCLGVCTAVESLGTTGFTGELAYAVGGIHNRKIDGKENTTYLNIKTDQSKYYEMQTGGER